MRCYSCCFLFCFFFYEHSKFLLSSYMLPPLLPIGRKTLFNQSIIYVKKNNSAGIYVNSNKYINKFVWNSSPTVMTQPWSTYYYTCSLIIFWDFWFPFFFHYSRVMANGSTSPRRYVIVAIWLLFAMELRIGKQFVILFISNNYT